jgi:hypothetical protein
MSSLSEKRPLNLDFAVIQDLSLDNMISMYEHTIYKLNFTSVAEPHHFYAASAPALGKHFDAAPAPAPAPTLFYSKAKFVKRSKV